MEDSFRPHHKNVVQSYIITMLQLTGTNDFVFGLLRNYYKSTRTRTHTAEGMEAGHTANVHDSTESSVQLS